MSSTGTTAVIEVSGVHWASSKAVTEAVLGRRAGVLAVDANPVSQTATVTYDPARTSVAALLQTPDLRSLVVWIDLGKDPLDTDLGGDELCGSSLVAGE